MSPVKSTGPAGPGGQEVSGPDQDTTTVMAGESSLAQVAKRLGVNLEGLLRANPQIGDPAHLMAGQEIRMPATQTMQTTGVAQPANETAAPDTTPSFGLPMPPSGDPMAKAMLQLRFNQLSQPTMWAGPVQQQAQTPIDQLEEAALNNDTAKMEALIKSGVDVNAKGSNGSTPLMMAAQAGNKDAMELLLKSGARVDETTADGQTALMQAARLGQKESVELLAQNHADVNHADKDGKTALTMAAGQGNSEMVQTLIDAKADVNLNQNDGQTALMLAAGRGDKDSIIALAQAGADPNVQGKDQKTALMKFLEQAHQQGQKPDLAAAKALIKASPNAAGLDVKNADGKTAMMEAAAFGDRDVVMALVNAKANVDIQDKNGRTATMDLMANLPPGETLTASEAKALTAASSHPDVKDKDGKTALMEAAGKGQSQMVMELVKSGKVNVDTQDQNGTTALMRLSMHPPDTVGDPDYMGAAKALIGGSKNLNLKAKVTDRTALMDAAMSKNRDMVRALNEAGANLNLRDSSGKTALMHAAALGDKWSVRFLLDKDWVGAGQGSLHHADPSIKDKNGDTALTLAQNVLASPQGLSQGDQDAYQAIIDLLTAP